MPLGAAPDQVPLVEEHISFSPLSLPDTHSSRHLSSGGRVSPRRAGLCVDSMSGAGAKGCWPKEPAGAGGGCWFTGCLARRGPGPGGAGAGLSALLSLGLSWNVAGPCWFLFNAVPYKRIFFKLYIYKNRSYTVYIKIDVRNMYECIK